MADVAETTADVHVQVRLVLGRQVAGEAQAARDGPRGRPLGVCKCDDLEAPIDAEDRLGRQQVASLDLDVERRRRDARVDLDRLATVLGVLLEAENSFLRTHDRSAKAARGHQPGSRLPHPPAWITRHVTLDSTDTERAAAKSPSSPMSTDGMALTEVPVREYVRIQRFGEGNRERKWVRIKAHMSHRWTSANPTRIVVHDQ